MGTDLFRRQRCGSCSNRAPTSKDPDVSRFMPEARSHPAAQGAAASLVDPPPAELGELLRNFRETLLLSNEEP